MAPTMSAASSRTPWQAPDRCSNVYEAEVPTMMDESLMLRPSLLAFRPSRVVRMSQQQHQNIVYKAQLLRRHDECPSETSGYDSSDTENSDAEYHAPKRDTTIVEDDEENERLRKRGYRLDRAESAIAIMALPACGPIPLLERMDSEDEHNDVDTIICDPTKLPRTLLVDENNFTISRETVMVRAATVPRGGVIKAGLLFKQGFGLRSGGWKVRYVVLTSAKMTFFREEHGRKRGEIDLAKCTAKSIEIMPRDSVFDGSQATMWRVAIRGKKGRVLLSAYTESEMKEWLRCLHVAIASQNFGRFTDFAKPSGPFVSEKSGRLLRSSGVM
ncbi:hypothetical protein CCR75_002182 [Bremia lactucae]|uniref:PH domain-containing protein n=1 Tax=Bremia lactucae TaxID=4779 RepID=A0A976FSF8_BRELC|nr:hypothetical protein CCR75_002182 [Bremia lactucae]